jgi:SprT protein
MSAEDKGLKILGRYLPEDAVLYCHALWKRYAFKMVVSKTRATKLGDFRYEPQTQSYTITVNGDLNKYAFLVTYLHEVAHLEVHLQYSNKPLPHGKEWKKAFQIQLETMLLHNVFPEDLIKPIKAYAKNPRASSAGDAVLYAALRSHNVDAHLQTSLAEIPHGEVFSFQNRPFRKGETRRTRVLCECLKTGRKYLIAKEVWID